MEKTKELLEEKAKALCRKLTGVGTSYPHPSIQVRRSYTTLGAIVVIIYTKHQPVFEASFYNTAFNLYRFNDGDWYDVLMKTLDDIKQADLDERFGPARPIL